MFTSFIGTDTEVTEAVPKSSAPWVWVGFLLAAAFLIVEITLAIMTLDEEGLAEPRVMLALAPLGLIGMGYWMFCVHRIHKILAELTHGRYPISPLEGALKHLIPFYNLYWVFHWPREFADYLTRRGRVRMISGTAIGLMLLFSLLTFRIVDGAIGMAFLFGVTMFISSKLKAHVKAVQGITPDQLPPLPDPRIFSRPIETPASSVQESVEGSGVG